MSQPEILLLWPDWFPLSLSLVDSWPLELPRVRLLSRSFARTPREARHRPECRYIFS